MLLLKNYKELKGSSLIESVIATTIISVCLLIALAIYINVVSLNKSFNYYQAKQDVERLHQEAIKTNDFEDNEFKFKGYSIKKSIDIDTQEHIAQVKYIISEQKKEYTIIKIVSYNEN